MREFGVTRVELGVQMPDDKIYKIIKRGHKVKDVVDATRELKNAGFKIGYHIMPGLPSSNPKKDLQLFKKIFSDEKFKPDQLKIYPCQVIKGSKLEEEYWKKKYKPYTKEQTEKLLLAMMKVVPRYCRVMRVMREIPPDYLVAGTTRIDLRKDVEETLRKGKDKISEIRFREIGFNQIKNVKNLKLKITKYVASGGDEYFLEIVNDADILFGLLRLRIFSEKAIIRELHVYGQSLKLGEEGKISQHTGLGKWLMSEAEKIAGSEQVQASSDDKHRAREKKCKKIFVISGIGVREYYRKLGYELEDTYMVKKLESL
jgi:elongator complex protein 3